MASGAKGVSALNQKDAVYEGRFDPEVLKKCFDVYDLDKSGKLDMDKLRHLLAVFGTVVDDRVLETMLIIADADGDGIVDYEDFNTLFKQPQEVFAKVKQ
jgi:Ca2+-binding EF-hand superfamily protein